MAPVAKMHTLGHDFIPEPIHAGGLRYHGMSPLVSLLKDHGDIEARSVHQRASFAAGVQFARAEGILPAPEPTHAIRVAIDEALDAKARGEERVILFNLCGHGHFDLGGLREVPRRARSRTTSTRRRPSRPRSRGCRRSRRAEGKRRGPSRGERDGPLPATCPSGRSVAASDEPRRMMSDAGNVGLIQST